jgi:hypothetical protein
MQIAADQGDPQTRNRPHREMPQDEQMAVPAADQQQIGIDWLVIPVHGAAARISWFSGLNDGSGIMRAAFVL